MWHMKAKGIWSLSLINYSQLYVYGYIYFDEQLKFIFWFLIPQVESTYILSCPFLPSKESILLCIKKKKKIHLTYIKKKERKRNPSYILTKQKMESISYGKMSRSFQRHFFFPFPPFFGYSLNSFLASEFSYLNVSLLIRSMFILFYK